MTRAPTRSRYQRRMVWGDVRASWTQFVAVFAMACMSVAAYTGLEGAWNGLRTNLDQFAADSSMADLWLTTTGVTPDDTARLAALPGVSAVETRTQAPARLVTSEGEVWLDLVIVDDPSWKVSRPQTMSGSSLAAQGTSVWLDDRLAGAHSLAPGATVRLASAAGHGSYTLAGTVMSPDRVYDVRSPDLTVPDPYAYGYGYVTPAVAAELYGGAPLPATVVLLRVDGDASVVERQVREEVGTRLVSLDDRTTKATVAQAFDRVTTIRNLSLLFSGLFVLVAVLAMYTSVRRLVDAQAKQIGMLRALGFSRGELVRHFSTFALVAGGAGVLAGLAVAPVLSMAVLRSQEPQFDLPSWSVAFTPAPLVVAAVVLAACLAGAALAARSCTRGEPAELLRPGVPMTSRGTKAGKLAGLSYPARWATRDATANPVRVFMGVVGVVGSMMLLFAGFGLPDTIAGEAEASYSPQRAPYAARVDFVLGTPPQAVETLPLGTSPQLLMQLPVATADGTRTTVTVLGSGARFPLTSTSGDHLGGNGVWLTKAAAARLALGPGDTATLVLPQGMGTAQLGVDDVADRAAPQGFVISGDTWTGAGLPFVPTSALVGDDADLRELATSPYVSFLVDRATQRDNALSLMDALKGIFMVLRVFAVVLTVVVLYALGSLTFDERRRQYATLKVLGLPNSELRRLSMVDNTVMTVVGLALGVPGGLWFLSVYVAQFNTTVVSYTVRISAVSVAVALGLATLVSSLTTLLLGRRIGRVDVVEALKGVD